MMTGSGCGSAGGGALPANARNVRVCKFLQGKILQEPDLHAVKPFPRIAKKFRGEIR
jgi:hypothetical protein